MPEVFKVDVLEVLWRFTLHSMIGRPETSKRIKINTKEQKIEDNQQYDAMARSILSLQKFWRKNHLKWSYG
jgi:hypothetical protein